MIATQRVVLVQVQLARNVEDCPEAIGVIRKMIVRNVSDAKDGPTTLAYVFTTPSSMEALAQRYRAISDHPDVVRVRVLPVGPGHASSSGILDPICSQIDNAWRKLREVREAQDVLRSKRPAIESEKGARRKAVVRRGRPRKRTKQAH